jgi:hypothetical protein
MQLLVHWNLAYDQARVRKAAEAQGINLSEKALKQIKKAKN